MNFFGTDGVRGKFNQSPITFYEISRLSIACCVHLKVKSVIIARDTRQSSPAIVMAIISSLLSIGINVINAGIAPSPGIAFLTKKKGVDLGFMVTASHNPYSDNGVKIFNHLGKKLTLEDEEAIEKLMLVINLEDFLVPAQKVGTLIELKNVLKLYNHYIVNLIPNISSKNIKIVIDCANGSASKWYPYILKETGISVISINDKPDGRNINYNCGVLDLENLKMAVMESKASFGIAVDGDGDRLVVCDENGRIVDGDQIIGTLAKIYKSRNKLISNNVVTNILSSNNLKKYLNHLGLNLVQVAPGDRLVYQSMEQIPTNLGGENSGHYILSDYSSTSDPLIAILQIIEEMFLTNEPISTLTFNFPDPIRISKNLPLNKTQITDSFLKSLINQAEAQLGNEGRIILRKSGTENLLRLTLEGDTLKQLELVAQQVIKALV